MAALDILSVAGRNVAEGWGSRRFRGLIGGFGVVSGLFRSPRGNPGDVGNRVPEGHGWSPPCARGRDHHAHRDGCSARAARVHGAHHRARASGTPARIGAQNRAQNRRRATNRGRPRGNHPGVPPARERLPPGCGVDASGQTRPDRRRRSSSPAAGVKPGTSRAHSSRRRRQSCHSALISACTSSSPWIPRPNARTQSGH